MDLNNQNQPCKSNICTKPFNCPGLMSDGHFITNWEPRKDFNQKLINKLNIMDEHKVRKVLMSKNPSDESIFNYTCKSTNPIDSSNINAYFDANLLKQLSKTVTVEPYSKD